MELASPDGHLEVAVVLDALQSRVQQHEVVDVHQEDVDGEVVVLVVVASSEVAVARIGVERSRSRLGLSEVEGQVDGDLVAGAHRDRAGQVVGEAAADVCEALGEAVEPLEVGVATDAWREVVEQDRVGIGLGAPAVGALDASRRLGRPGVAAVGQPAA